MSLIKTTNLTKHFPAESGLLEQILSDDVVHAVDGVDLSIDRGETLGLVGESGCGKSTLGRTLLRLDEPTDGSIEFKNQSISSMSQRELRPLRTEMQYVFQDPAASLNPRKTVGDILMKPILYHDLADEAEARERAATLLERVGLQVDYMDRYPHEFSGGQQQRISLARALSVNPEFILLDEPVSALDVSVQAQVLDLIQDLKNEYDLTLLFITHNLNVVRHVCDKVAVMYLGEIVEQAPVAELFEDPHHPYTQTLLDSVLLPDADADAIRVERDSIGEVPSPINPPSGCRFRTRCPEAMPECKEVNPELRPRTRGSEQQGDVDPRTVACHLYE